MCGLKSCHSPQNQRRVGFGRTEIFKTAVGRSLNSRDLMDEIHSYRAELKFDCDCGHENLQVVSVSSAELKTEDEVGFMLALQPAPKCRACRHPHMGQVGIGVTRVAAARASISR